MRTEAKKAGEAQTSSNFITSHLCLNSQALKVQAPVCRARLMHSLSPPTTTPTCCLYPLAPTSLPWALLGERSESFLLRLCLPSPTLLPPICDFEGFWKFTDLNIRRWEFPSLRDSFPLGPPQGLSGSQGSLTKNLVCVKAALPCNTPAPSLSHQSQPFLFLSE